MAICQRTVHPVMSLRPFTTLSMEACTSHRCFPRTSFRLNGTATPLITLSDFLACQRSKSSTTWFEASAQIAGFLNLSPKTVDTYRASIVQKLGIENVVDLVKFAMKWKLI